MARDGVVSIMSHTILTIKVQYLTSHKFISLFLENAVHSAAAISLSPQ